MNLERAAQTCVPGAVTLFARKDGVGISLPLDLLTEDEQASSSASTLAVESLENVSALPRLRGGNGSDGSSWNRPATATWRHEDSIAIVRTTDEGKFVVEGVPSGATEADE